LAPDAKSQVLEQVWNSRGTLVSAQASVWRFSLSFHKGMKSAVLGSRDEKLKIGHFLHESFDAPEDRSTLEIKDR